MVNIAMRSQEAIDRGSLLSVNTVIHGAVQAQTVHTLNTRKQPCARQPGNPFPTAADTPPAHSRSGSAQSRSSDLQSATLPQNTNSSPASSQSGNADLQSVPGHRPTPPLRKTVQKGQKTALGGQPLHTLRVCLGWNTANAGCDVDVSAFLLTSAGKVPGDDWFVFYGQTESPDHSTVFCPDHPIDRESITIRLDRLDPLVKRIVFVLTINEALERNMHFGMVQDAYIRILNEEDQEELVSFRMDEYYTNVISMMIGEIYQHNGNWKFNAVGSGLAKDLSGLCGLYGVQVE